MSPTYGGGGGGTGGEHATHAWHHLLRSTFHTLPRELEKARRHRHALRRLVRRH
jgi:50S ribosomal subunit-associated GTPase HflX